MPVPKDALDPTWSNTVGSKLLPEGKLAIALDGSWVSNNWLDSGATPWKGWDKTMATDGDADPGRRRQRPGQPVRRLDLGDPEEVRQRQARPGT